MDICRKEMNRSFRSLTEFSLQGSEMADDWTVIYLHVKSVAETTWKYTVRIPIYHMVMYKVCNV